MFDWLGDFIGGIGDAIGSTFDFLGEQISNAIWNTMLQWFYETIYNAVADFFTMMGNMGADIFDIEWVQATINLFTLFGWGLFVAGTVVAVFDVAIEYQNGRANCNQCSKRIFRLFSFWGCACGIVQILYQSAKHFFKRFVIYNGRTAKPQFVGTKHKRFRRLFCSINTDNIWVTESVMYDSLCLLRY